MLSWILWLGTTSEITLGSNKSLGTKDLFQFQPEVRTTSGQMTRPHGIDQEDCSRFKQRQPSSPSGAGSDCASWQTSGSSGTWGRSLKTGNEEYCWTLKCRIYPSCSYASWWKASWFHHGGSSSSETHSWKKFSRDNTTKAPGCERCGSWTWPSRSWARDWSETRVWLSVWHDVSSLNCHHSVLLWSHFTIVSWHHIW